MNYIILYHKETKQIEQFVGRSKGIPTLADVGKIGENYDTSYLINPGFPITRDCKVILSGKVIVGTSPHPNPVLPVHENPPRNFGSEIDALKARVESLELKKEV